MKFIHVTAPDGRTIGITPDQVEGVQDAQPGMYAPGVKTVIVLVNGIQAVRETREEVEKRLEST